MKKAVGLILVLVILVIGISAAFAEERTDPSCGNAADSYFCCSCCAAKPVEQCWTCPECGMEATGNFCSNCGAAKPVVQYWTCLECGTEAAGNFCSNCGASRKDNTIAKVIIGGWSPVSDIPDDFWTESSPAGWKRIYFFPDIIVVLTKEDETEEYPCEYFGKTIQVGENEISVTVSSDQLTLQSGEREITLERYVSDLPFQYEITENNTIRIVEQYIEAPADISFPAEIDGLPVESIGCAFYDHDYEEYNERGEKVRFAAQTLKIVYIPEGIREIGENAFSFQTGLQYCYLPSSVRSIGDFAFLACISLSYQTIPENLESLGTACISSAVRELTLPRTLKTLGDSAFDVLPELTYVRILCDDIELKDQFRSCHKLEKVSLEGGTVSLTGHSFGSCPAIKEFIISPDTKLKIVDPNLPLLKEDMQFSGKDLLEAAANTYESRLYALQPEIEKQEQRVQSSKDKLQRWIDGGKKSENDIEKQKQEVQKEEEKLAELYAQLEEAKNSQ